MSVDIFFLIVAWSQTMYHAQYNIYSINTYPVSDVNRHLFLHCGLVPADRVACLIRHLFYKHRSYVLMSRSDASAASRPCMLKTTFNPVFRSWSFIVIWNNSFLFLALCFIKHRTNFIFVCVVYTYGVN